MISEWHLGALPSSRVLRNQSSSNLKMLPWTRLKTFSRECEIWSSASDPQIELRRSIRQTKAPKRYSPALHYLLLTNSGKPEYYEEALQVEAKAEWELAVDDEIVSLMENHT